MGLISLFKPIDERDDQVVFRDNTGFNMLPLTMIGAGATIFLVAIPFTFVASGSDAEAMMATVILSGLSVVVGLVFRAISGKTTVEFDRKRITERGIRRDFDDIACVVITESIRVMRSKHNRHKIPQFRVLLGLGSADEGVLQEKLDHIRAQNPGGDFIAGESSLDEELADELIRDAALEPYELIEATGYPALWRTSHRLAREADAAYVELTGSNFTVALGEDVALSLADRLSRRGYESAKSHPAPDDLTVAEHEGSLSISWQYSLTVPMVLTAAIGAGVPCGFALLPSFSGAVIAILAVVLGVPAIFMVWWLFGRHGEHRLVIEQNEVRYEPPAGRNSRAFSLDELYEVYVRPNVSGGMSTLLLLTHGDPVVVRGKLSSLEAIDDSIRRFLASQGEA